MKIINVTKTYLPPLEEFTEYLKNIWETGQLTNNGLLVQKLEMKLKKIFKCKALIFCQQRHNRITDRYKIVRIKKRNHYYAFFLCRNHIKHCLGKLHSCVY